MKRLLTLLALVLCSCAETFVGEEIARSNNENLPDLTAEFAEEDATRTYIENGKYLRWCEDDRLTVFFGNTLNRQYKFNGKTGDNSGTFSLIPDGMLGTGNTLNRIYALYPYSSDASISDEGVISLTLPSTQTYAENSFGISANTMVAVTENLEDTFLAFKNACGYLKLKLYNAEGAKLKSIEVKGNNGEKIAGDATLSINFGETPTLTMAESATDTIILDCGEGIALGTTADTATELWVVVPATTFADGLTITATDTEGGVFEKSTTSEIIIERNVIQPMAALEAEFVLNKPANNEIWYTNGRTTTATTPTNTDVFGASIVSNTYDAEKECWVIKFDGDVTTIGGSAFAWCSSLTSVTIPDSVTTIGEDAFYSCSSLTSVTIPDSVTTIGDMAFAYCSSLTSVIIPDSVTSIGEWAFQNCRSLTSVTIGDSVTTIGCGAFSCCHSLAEFKSKFASEDGRCLIVDGTLTAFAPAGISEYIIPDNVTKISCFTFIECFDIISITIPDNVNTIEHSAFVACVNLQKFNGKFSSEDGKCLIVNGTLNSFAIGSNITEYTIPENVTAIGDYAFFASKLTSIIIPENVTAIGDYAFYYCSSLTSATIPDSVTTIGYYAFSDCSSLTSVTIGDSVTTIGYGSLESCESLTSVYCQPTTPPNCEYVGCSCKIYVPAGSGNAYRKATGWERLAEDIVEFDYDKEEIVISGNVIYYTSVDGKIVTPYNTNAFGANIISNTYENGKGVILFDRDVIYINYDAFQWCTSLTSITIPDTVIEVYDAFYRCYNLREFGGSYASADGRCLIIDGTLCAFASADLTEYTIPYGVTAIGPGTFQYCMDLTSITIPDGVTEIGYSAFEYCDSLTSITIPDSVTYIGSQAFRSCDNLSTVILGKNITYIANHAFSSCRNITEIIIPNSVTSIGREAFNCCESATNLTIGNSVTTIGDSAFRQCSSLISVTIPDSVTSIGAEAFSRCSSLTEFRGKFASNDGRSLIIEGKLAFFAPVGLTEYVIPDGVTSIGRYAFYCDSLTSVTIPDCVTTIEAGAFMWCESLTSVTIPDSVTSIESETFYCCKSLTSVTIPDRVNRIGYAAFSGCSNLTSLYCKATTPPAGSSYMFSSNASGRKIYVPAESVEAYRSASYWSDYASYIVGYDFEKGEIVEDESAGDQNKNYSVVLNNAWRQSTSVSNPDSSLYDGVYESYSNYNVDNGVATMYIDIEGYTEFSIYVRSNAESSYDYVTVSELDSTTAKTTTSGNQSSGTAISNYTKVTYTGIDGGSHRITVTYRKDGSVNNGTDRGYLIIPKNQ